VLYPLSSVPNLFDQVGEIAPMLDKVDLGAVDHEKRGLRVVVKELSKGLGEALEVVLGDTALVGPCAFLDASAEDVGTRLEVDDEVWTRNLRIEEREELPVQAQLGLVERNTCEDAILGEQIIADDAPVLQIAGRELALLAIAPEQKLELHVEGVAAWVVIKRTKKSVVVCFLEDEAGIRVGRESSGESRLSNPDRALYSDVSRAFVRHHLQGLVSPNTLKRPVSIAFYNCVLYAPGMVTEVARRTAGALFMVGIPGHVIDPKTRKFLEAYRPGGVILFRRNVRSAAQLQRLTAEIHAISAGPSPIVAIDHEGGRVHRLPRPFTHFPPASQVAAAGGVRVARAVGEAMGRELAAVGIDLDFAPVLDVATNHRNQVIGDRAFGTDPQTVARCALALARGLLAAGVVPCGKHFPGHGGTVGDSHRVLPRDRRSRRELRAVDLVPFERAIAARLPALMTAHVVYPALDPTRPATLSRRIAHDLLRRRLGFAGVLFSDDLEMQAVAGRRRPERAAVAALEAGCDMLLVCESMAVAGASIESVATALARGRLPGNAIATSLGRIQQLRRHIGPDRPARPLAWSRHAALARRLTRSV